MRAPSNEGIGFASFLHGAGFTGSGEVHLASVVDVEATAEGHVRVLAASTEIGQGTNTIFAQIIADTLGIGYDQVDVAQPDTANVPNSGPTVASRTAMVVGKLVETAALTLKQNTGRRGTARCRRHRRRVHPCVPHLHRHARSASREERIQPASRSAVGRRGVSR